MQYSFKLLEQVKNYKPITGPGVIEEFLSGTIHSDFENELLARIEQMRDFYEECGSKEYLETRGGIKALRLTMTIFHDLLANRLKDLEHEEQDNVEEI